MTSPWPDPDPNPLPTGPRADDPTGLRFDRADLDEPATTTTLREAGGWALTGRGPYAMQQHDTVPVEPQQTGRGRPPFNLPGLRRAGMTAADWDRIERDTATPIAVDDPLCGHGLNDVHDGSCDYRRGVVLDEYPAPEGMEAVVEQARARYAATLRSAA